MSFLASLANSTDDASRQRKLHQKQERGKSYVSGLSATFVFSSAVAARYRQIAANDRRGDEHGNSRFMSMGASPQR